MGEPWDSLMKYDEEQDRLNRKKALSPLWGAFWVSVGIGAMIVLVWVVAGLFTVSAAPQEKRILPGGCITIQEHLEYCRP